MSTKTTFKRIALVAVAALGLGVLSVAPSSAAVIGLTATPVNGTATTATSDSSTAATLQVRFFAQTAAVDTASVVFAQDSIPTDAVTTRLRMSVLDTATATSVTSVSGLTENARDSATVTTAVTVSAGTNNTYAAANFAVFMDGVLGIKAGTYALTAIVTPYSDGAAGTAITKSISIVVSTASADSEVASAAQTSAFIGAAGANNTSDTAISAVATASGTTVGEIDVTINNAAGGTGIADDSVTATITGPGAISFNDSTYGKAITYSATAGVATISIRADGNAGVGTIEVSTTAGFKATKTVTFYAKAAKTLTTKLAPTNLVVGANDSAVAVTAVDASGTNWAGQAYIVASASADALVAGSTTPVACSYQASSTTHWCPVTSIAAGTAKFKVIDAATVALATATSTEFSVTVSSAPAATVKLSFDKASYQPYEKAYIKVSVLDAAGTMLGAKSYTNALATGGITTNIAFSGTAPDMTATTVAINALDGTDKFGGYLTYVVYMPAQGDVTITAKGGTGLPVSGQVAVTATASVVNSSVDAATDAANEATDAANAATDAALAAADAADAATAAAQDASDAVAALSATVAKLVASLKAQITSLTNLVIKIQKKVRA
jgi:hypothetical protein